MHPFLAKVTTRRAPRRAQGHGGLRPRRRAVGDRERHRLPRQRLLVVHDRRGRVRQQPARLTPRATRRYQEDRMAEAYIVDAVRTPVGKRGGCTRARCTPPTSARHVLDALVERTRRRPGRRRRRDHGLLRHDRLAGRRRRPHRVAGRRAARARARRDDRPAVRLVPAGGALRRPGRHVRHPGPRRRRRRAEHVGDPDLVGDDGRRSSSASPRRSRSRRAGRAVRRPGGLAVPRRRDDRREVGLIRERHGGVRLSRATGARSRRSTRAASTARSRRSGTSPCDEGPRRDTSLEKMAGLKPLREGGRITAARRLADLATPPRRC